MLCVSWLPQHGGAPDSKGYDGLVDRLYAASPEGVRGELLMEIAKPAAAIPEPGPALRDHVAAWAPGCPDRRAVVLVHGYDFDLEDAGKGAFEDNPYRRVYAAPGRELIPGESWLPFVGAERAVAFAWNSAPGFADYAAACWTNPYEYAVYDLAPLAAKALASLVLALRGQGLTVDLVAHSLGTRTALKAVERLARAGHRDALRRGVMISGSEFSIDARDAVRSADIEVLNLVNRSDAVLTWGAAQMGGRLRVPNSVPARVIGRDGLRPSRRWLDLQLDHDDEALRADFDAWFKMRDYALTPAPYPLADGERRGEHWASYMHAGHRKLFADFLDNPAMSVGWFQDNGAVDGVERFRYGLLPGRVPATPATCRARKALYRDERIDR